VRPKSESAVLPKRWISTLLCLLLSSCGADDPTVAEDLELARLEGRWYEIARVPRDHDRHCHDTTADYRLTGPDQLELVHSCHVGSFSGPLKRFAAPAEVDDPAVPAKLSIQIGLYRGAYWVLEVGKGYEYAVVGHPSLTMLWVLSRDPTLDPAIYERILARAARQGFGTNLLQRTPQSLAGAR
jgi:apolipoprotein D and lipocalin family protein